MRPKKQADEKSNNGSTKQTDLQREPFSAFHDEFACDETIVIFEPGSLLINRGDTPEKLYVLHGGRAEICKEHELRRDFVTLVDKDRIYGVVEALSGDPFESSMKTITRCTVGIVDRDKFLGRIGNDPAMCFRLAQIMGRMDREIQFSLTLNRMIERSD